MEFPQASTERSGNSPADVGSHPAGESPFGVQDMMGNVWQWTNDYCDEHTCFALVRGGSTYKQHHIARYYFAQPADLTQVIPPVPSSFALLRPYLAHFFPVFSRFLRVFTAWPRRFQRAPSRNPGPRNSRQGDQERRTPPFIRHPRC